MADSAAVRAFQVAEILENILLMVQPRYANILDPACVFHVDANAGPPVTEQLFALQRVDRTFAATIRGSRKLRKRMLLEPYAATDTSDYHRALRPLRWFLMYIGLPAIFDYGSTPAPRKLGFTETFDDSHVHAVETRLSKESNAGLQDIEYASWRNIKLCEHTTDDAIEIHFEVSYQDTEWPKRLDFQGCYPDEVCFRYLSTHACFVRMGVGEHDIPLPKQTSPRFALGCAVTLGDFWTKFRNVVVQDKLGHRLSSGKCEVVGNGVWKREGRESRN